MKHVLLLAITFMAMTPVVFAMEEDDKPIKRKITVIADMRKDYSPPKSCLYSDLGSFVEPPGYTLLGKKRYVYEYRYDNNNHIIFLGLDLKHKYPRSFDFNIGYRPTRLDTLYRHHFTSDLPEGEQDEEVQATLQSIERVSRTEKGETTEILFPDKGYWLKMNFIPY